MQMYGHFEGFPLNSALFGLVIYLHLPYKSTIHVGKYTVCPMDAMVNDPLGKFGLFGLLGFVLRTPETKIYEIYAASEPRTEPIKCLWLLSRRVETCRMSGEDGSRDPIYSDLFRRL